jgi:hypothetical protein
VLHKVARIPPAEPSKWRELLAAVRDAGIEIDYMDKVRESERERARKRERPRRDGGREAGREGGSGRREATGARDEHARTFPRAPREQSGGGAGWSARRTPQRRQACVAPACRAHRASC